jgi:hypothetical protein
VVESSRLGGNTARTSEAAMPYSASFLLWMQCTGCFQQKVKSTCNAKSLISRPSHPPSSIRDYMYGFAPAGTSIRWLRNFATSTQLLL